MEGNWSIKLNGEIHAVRVYVPTVSFWPQLTLHLDGTLIHKQPVFLFVGELCRLSILGHHMTIRINGFGVFGNLALLIDGIEAAQFSKIANERGSLPPFDKFTETSVVETQRVEESLGEEAREIDNSRSAVGIQRTIRLSREWTQSYVLEREVAAKAAGELSVQGAWIADFRASAEGAIRRRYELTVAERRTYSEELTIEVPARTKVQVVLKWKQIWQCGVVVVRGGSDGVEVHMPFKVCLGPTFDQSQVDA
jgi:hypothetical protein